MWDAAAGAYPTRVPEALNIFFGPVLPELLTDPDTDYWANPEATTLAQVEAALLYTSARVLRAAETQQIIFVDATRLAVIDTRLATLSNPSPSASTTASAILNRSKPIDVDDYV